MPATQNGYSAETRTLPLRRRCDLECHEVSFGGTRFWHVKDPISLRYYQLKPEEFAVLGMLDGTVSLRDIRRRFENEFAPLRLALPQLQSFLAMMHSSNLIVSDAAGQSEVIFERQRTTQQQRLIAAASSLLAMRFRGFDPHALLDALLPWTRWLFRPFGATLAGTWIVMGLAFAVARIDSLQLKLPQFHEFFSPGNWIWLAATLATTKVLHELGHALSCRHFGSDCHEMGFMLLVGTPCLYCNVSDAWMLPSRWRRIAISAAGMYFEMLLAATCLFLWWFSLPGLFNSLCLNVVVVCTVSTVFFNGNPLLRYDGYYIIADLLEIPNLRQQASALIGNALGRWYFDADVANQRMMPERHRLLLATWGLGSGIYRLVMLWGILWFVDEILEPYGLQPVAVVLAAISVAGVLLGPLWVVGQLVSNPFWSRTVNWPRFWWRSLLTLVALGFLVTTPLPFSVSAPVIVQPENMQRVFVAQSGKLQWSIPVGTQVQAGEVLGRLESLELDRDIVKLSGEVTLLERQIQNLEARRTRERDQVDALIPTAQERLIKKRDELKQRQSDAAKLVIKAPTAGRVLAAPEVNSNDADQRTHLVAWTGSALDASNAGATLTTGTEFCWIAPSERFEATLAVDENSIEFITSGQRVTMLLEHAGLRPVTGLVVDVAESDVSVAPRELLQHPCFPTKVGSDGVARPVSTAYFARVAIDNEDSLPDFVPRGIGQATVEAAPQSIAARLGRFIRQTFRFR